MSKIKIPLKAQKSGNNHYSLQSDQLFQRYANKTLPDIPGAKSYLTPYNGEWKEQQLLHLLRRCTFGIRKSHVDTLRHMTMQETINTILTPPAVLPLPPVNNYSKTITDPDVRPGETWVRAARGKDEVNQARIESLKSWWSGLIIAEPPSILEKLTFFWHNHFATRTGEVDDARFSYRHIALLRGHALGNFKTLVKEITVDPCMLVFLNGTENKKGEPDENYGRELQELFTVGRGSGYTEADVKAAAKVLTGWKAYADSISSDFYEDDHESGDKQFSTFYNNYVIKGQEGRDGLKETDELINMLLSQQEAAKFICRKLYRWFVYYKIDQATEINIITPLADIFRKNNYEIRPVLQALLQSDHFYDMANIGCYIKSPIDICLGMIRNFDVELPSDRDSLYETTGLLAYYSSTMNMEPGDPPNVAGWPAFRQEPLYYEIWINSDTLPKRNLFTDALLEDGIYTESGFMIKADVIRFISQSPDPGDPNKVIQYCINYLLANDLSDAQKAFAKNILLSNQSSDRYWKYAWEAFIKNPGETPEAETVRSRLTAFLLYLSRLAEFQLC